MKKKPDEENFDEAIAQAYRAWSVTKVPFDIAQLFDDPALATLSPTSPPFFHMLAALKTFTERPPHTLPLSATLPDMKADTTNYVHLQRLYKTRAEEEKSQFATILTENGVQLEPDMIDEFVRNAHGLKVVRGCRWDVLSENPQLTGKDGFYQINPFFVTHTATSGSALVRGNVEYSINTSRALCSIALTRREPEQSRTNCRKVDCIYPGGTSTWYNTARGGRHRRWRSVRLHLFHVMLYASTCEQCSYTHRRLA